MNQAGPQPDPTQQIDCRRLGHQVTLAYCIRESVDLPCRLVYECWGGCIRIHDYLLTMYTESQLETLQTPTSKLSSLIDILHRVRS